MAMSDESQTYRSEYEQAFQRGREHSAYRIEELERELSELNRDCVEIVAAVLKRGGKDVTTVSTMDRIAELHKAERDLVTERALADRLAGTLDVIQSGGKDQFRWSLTKAESMASEALAAWKEARHE